MKVLKGGIKQAGTNLVNKFHEVFLEKLINRNLVEACDL